ncbi:transposase, partial [Candidatus Falkowbacteria bacterium]|nr:transposase [Candidatus Falkowbacteria bacterium]
MNQYKYHKEYRLKGFDYSKPGLYFITICTKNRICDLGKIEDSIMKLSEIGEIAEKFWIEISNRFKNVELDEFILMPNHLHGILKLTNHGRSAPR